MPINYEHVILPLIMTKYLTNTSLLYCKYHIHPLYGHMSFNISVVLDGLVLQNFHFPIIDQLQ